MNAVEIMARAIDQASETRFYVYEAKEIAQAALTALADAGEQLVREGLARRWGDRRGWCKGER